MYKRQASTYEKFSAVKNHLKEFKEDVTFEYFNFKSRWSLVDLFLRVLKCRSAVIYGGLSGSYLLLGVIYCACLLYTS